MRLLKVILPAFLLLAPIFANAAFATPWNATSTDKGFITPNLINGNSPWIVISGTGTSTFAGPLQATCFSLNGTTCLNVPSLPISIANGGTATTTGGNIGGVEYFDGTEITNSSQFTTANSATPLLGIGTTSPWRTLSVTGSSDLGTNALAGSFTGTSTATSTLVGAIQSPCFSTDGVTCLVSSSGTIGTGTTGQMPYYAANGTTLTATSTLFISTAAFVGVGSTTPGSVFSIGTSPTQIANFAPATSTIYSALAVSGVNNAYLSVGTTSPNATYVRNYLADFTGTFSDFLSVNVNNNTNGICSSADLAVNNDAATVSSNFGDLGHTSSAFTGSGCTNNPFTGFGGNSTYLFDPNGNMNFAIASTSNASFRWFTGGYAVANQKLVLNNIGNLGIGSTTPGSLLSVHANDQSTKVNLFTIGSSTATATTTLFQITNTGSTGIGSAPPSSTYLMVTPPSTPVFTFGFRVNNTNGTRAVGLNSLATYNGTTDQVTTAQGGGVNGGRYTATNQTVGNNVAMASGVSSQILVTGTLASTTNGVAYQIELPTVSTGNLLTNNYGAWVRGGTVSGTITNEAGIAIENQTTATNNSELLLGTATIPTGNYGVYQSDTYNNYFAGNVGVGTTTPYAALSVSGNFVLGGNITATSTATSTFTGGIAASDFCTATKCLSSAGGGGSSQWTGTSPGSIYYTTGNVGIGTTTPWAALSVSTTTQDSATAALFSVASTTNAALFTVLGNGRIGVGTTTTTYGTSSFTQAISNAATTIGGLLINTATNVANAFSIVNSSGTNVFNVDTTASNPFLGIGTTTPWGTLSVVGDGTDPILAVATSTNSGKPSFEIDQLGHVVTSGKTPVISSCGTGSPTAAGNDTNFRITTGTSASVCTATFANSYTNAPICIGTEESNGSTAVNASSTASNVVFSFGASLTIKQIAVHCEVYQ